MARKDSTNLPVDNYRKQIDQEKVLNVYSVSKVGKQDWKKSKKEIKAQKAQSENKWSIQKIVKDVLLILVAFVGLCSALYFTLYCLINKDITDTDDTMPQFSDFDKS